MKKRRTTFALAGLAALAASAIASGRASAATLTVCPNGCAFSQIAPAIAAASPGDTVSVAPGVYSGGFTIDKNLSLVGAGAGATKIKGGGPVITIGAFLAPSEPTVSISGVTVTGGMTHSSVQAPFRAIGGGIYIPPSGTRQQFTPGATVTISDSVIAGNVVSPTSSAPFGPTCPDGNPCPFAAATGGGIGSDGDLTLIRTVVTRNEAIGPIASDADGGGIFLGFSGSSLTLDDSIVSDNLAAVSDPNGRFAEGGGIFTSEFSTVSIDHSQIVGNAADLTSSFPYFIGGGQVLEIGANSGGMHLQADNGQATITNSQIDGNSVDVTALNGEPEVFDAGMCACGNPTLDLSDSSVSNNRIDASIGSNTDLFANTGFTVGGALEFDAPATIDHALIAGNSTSVTSPTGGAIASGTVASFFPAPPTSVLSNSEIIGNRVKASSPRGSATILGVGVMNAAGLDLEHDVIGGNVGIATAPTGAAQGGGIWNGSFPCGPPVGLTVNGTTVVGNALLGSAGVSVQGGGLFSSAPLTLGANTIAGNKPDNCSGTTC